MKLKIHAKIFVAGNPVAPGDVIECKLDDAAILLSRGIASHYVHVEPKRPAPEPKEAVITDEPALPPVEAPAPAKPARKTPRKKK